MDTAGGVIFDIKEFTVHDGPGIRATVFFKGCPLRCLWCHNPEGIQPQPQLLVTESGCEKCGKCYEVCGHKECVGMGRCIHRCPRGLIKRSGKFVAPQALAEHIHKLAPLLTDGGVTISGGEPLLQAAFLEELLFLLRPLHTVIETSGYAGEEAFQMAAHSCDMIYLDIKHSDSEKHRLLTGAGNEKILKNLNWLISSGKAFTVRVPLIPGCTDDENNLMNIALLLKHAKNLAGVELLPANPFAGAKYPLLGREFPLGGKNGSTVKASSAADPVSVFAKQHLPCRMIL